MRRDPHRAGRGQAIATSSPMPSRACSSTGNRPRPTLRRRCATTSVFATIAFATCARDEADDWEAPRPSILGSLVGASALRRALSIVPLAVIGYVIAWFLYFEPSQNVTAKSAVEAKPEVIQAAAPVEPPPPRGRSGRGQAGARTCGHGNACIGGAGCRLSPSPRRRGPCRKTRSRSCRASSVPPVSPPDRSTASSGRRRRQHCGATPSRAAWPSRRSRRRRRCFGCARKPRPRSSSRITARSQRRRRRLPNLARTAGAGRCVQS